MHLYFISTSRWPSELADARLIAKAAEYTAANGHQVSLLLPQRKQTNLQLTSISGWKYFDIDKTSFKLTQLPVCDFRFLASTSFWQPLLTYSFFLNLLFYLLAKQPKHLYLHQREFILLKLFFPHTTIIFESHDRPTDYYQKKLFQITQKLVDFWVVPNQALKNDLLRHHVSSDIINVLPAGIELNKYNQIPKRQARNQLHLPKSKKLIGYIGRLEGKEGSRGIDDIIKALRLICQQDRSFHFVCVGGRHQFVSKYAQLAQEQEVSDHCTFTGQVPHPQIPLYLSSFDVCVLPFPNKPHYRQYMAPMKLFEYMASKRPIVTTNLPSIREFLTLQNAIFVKPNNPRSLASGILKAVKLPQKSITQTYNQVKPYQWIIRQQRIITQITTDL